MTQKQKGYFSRSVIDCRFVWCVCVCIYMYEMMCAHHDSETERIFQQECDVFVCWCMCTKWCVRSKTQKQKGYFSRNAKGCWFVWVYMYVCICTCVYMCTYSCIPNQVCKTCLILCQTLIFQRLAGLRYGQYYLYCCNERRQIILSVPESCQPSLTQNQTSFCTLHLVYYLCIIYMLLWWKAEYYTSIRGLLYTMYIHYWTYLCLARDIHV